MKNTRKQARRLQSERPLLLVEWIDSHAGRGWQPLDEIAANVEPVYCRSVGWLVSKSENATVLVAHVSGERNEDLRQYGQGDIAIPNQAIVKVTRVCA